VESYSQMPAKCILAHEFSNFSRGSPSELHAFSARYQRLHPPFQNSWIRPCIWYEHAFNMFS
jgi:hypothetical protein